MASLEMTERRWTTITNNIQKARNYSLDVFIQHNLSVTHQLVKRGKIFALITEMLQTRTEALEWLKHTEDWSKIIHKLQNPDSNFRNGAGRKTVVPKYVNRINRLGAVAIYPLLMVGYKEYWMKEDLGSFRQLAKACLLYHVRTMTIGQSGVEQYRAELSEIAQCLLKKRLPVSEVIDQLCRTKSYITDDRLGDLLRAYSPDAVSGQMILEIVEEKSYHETKEPGHDVTIEHIMPQNLDDAWWNYMCRQHDCGRNHAGALHRIYCGYLGNMMLLENFLNQSLSNKPFEAKKACYNKSCYPMAKEMACNDVREWNVEQIQKRQSDLADMLTVILDLPKLNTHI